MTLIKNKPVANVILSLTKNGKINKIDFQFPENEQELPCLVCSKLTKKTFMGFAECEECRPFEYCCQDCENMVSQSSYCQPGDDRTQYISHWIACGIRKMEYDSTKGFYTQILGSMNPESRFSVNDVSISEKKKCFKPRDPKKSRYCPIKTHNIPLFACNVCGYFTKLNSNCTYDT